MIILVQGTQLETFARENGTRCEKNPDRFSVSAVQRGFLYFWDQIRTHSSVLRVARLPPSWISTPLELAAEILASPWSSELVEL